MNAHRNPMNTGTTHSTNQEREEAPPRLEDVNLEDISIRFLCTYSTHPSWKQIVSSRNGYGQTIAHIAVTLGYFRLLQHLSTWQIDVNAMDDMGSTALHYAYLFRQEECARLLIDSGADPFILDDLGRAPSNLNPSLEVRVHPAMDILIKKTTSRPKKENLRAPLTHRVQIADHGPSLYLDRTRRFTSIPAHTADLSHHTEITLQVIPKLKYTLRLLVDNRERELLRVNNQTWEPTKPLYAPCFFDTCTC